MIDKIAHIQMKISKFVEKVGILLENDKLSSDLFKQKSYFLYINNDLLESSPDDP